MRNDVVRRVVEHLYAHLEEMVSDLRMLALCDTPSSEKDRLDAFARDVLQPWIEEHVSCEIDLVDTPDHGSHVVARTGTQGELTMVVGHYDTVWKAGTVESWPVEIAGGVARGPGVFDMKAGLVQGVWALRALQAVGCELTPVALVITSDEEIGSPSSRALIERLARRATRAYVLEPSDDGRLKTQRKGVSIFRIEVLGRAAHAGLEPEQGVSAVDELARAVLSLSEAAAPRLGTTVNVGVVAGGTGTNIVAARAHADIEIRTSSEEEATRMTDFVLGLSPSNPEAVINVTGGVSRPPMERTPQVDALWQRARCLGEQLGMSISEAPVVGGVSDGNLISDLGVPVLDGLGAVGGGAHSDEEWVDTTAMPLRSALLAGLLAPDGIG